MKKFNDSYIGLRSDLLKFIPKGNNNILDVGCATGVNGRYLLDNDYAKIVYGIEYSKEMALQAEKNNTTVFCGDLNSIDFINKIISEDVKFDYIIFGDILEHLVDPLTTLIQIKKMLNTNGKVIISLPNIAHIELFIQVYLKGTWPKNERGIFDKTHLRWFTKRDVYEMVKMSKLKVLKYEHKYRSRDAMGAKKDWVFRLLKLIKKDLVTFQHVVICGNE